ncbi:hypothetical protein M8J76_010212 [Diaphorina citri]|nr:hypothetical protein M8J76_010212 [Diaphorina citri]
MDIPQESQKKDIFPKHVEIEVIALTHNIKVLELKQKKMKQTCSSAVLSMHQHKLISTPVKGHGKFEHDMQRSQPVLWFVIKQVYHMNIDSHCG